MMSGCKRVVRSEDEKLRSLRHLVGRKHRPRRFGRIGNEPWPAEEMRARVQQEPPKNDQGEAHLKEHNERKTPKTRKEANDDRTARKHLC